MSSSNASTLEELITCQICLYEYDEEIRKPKFLQCAHTICLVCFQAARQHDTIVCPFCRRCTSKDNDGGAVWILPTNQYVLELLRMNRTSSRTMLSTVPVREPLEQDDGNVEEDEEFMIALAMSSREMEEEESLNEAIRQSLIDQQQERQYITVTAAAAIQRTIVSNSPSDDTSNEENFYVILFVSALLYYGFLLFWQIFMFFLYHLDFLSGVFLFVFCYVPYRCLPSSRSSQPSYEELFYSILFFLVLSHDAFVLFCELFMFFFYHLELLLVIVFIVALGSINLGLVNTRHVTVPLSHTF